MSTIQSEINDNKISPAANFGSDSRATGWKTVIPFDRSTNSSLTVQYGFTINGNDCMITDSTYSNLPQLELETKEGIALNTTTARLSAETNLGELEENVGFEWRRYDAPETLPSQKVTSVVVDGQVMGILSNLNPDVYYNYRPFFTSCTGKTYYGEWITTFTGDANVYFEPTVKTYEPENISTYSATLKGCALRGSDDIRRQGFQYWIVSSSRASSGLNEIEVSGQKFSYTLTDLQAGSTYIYRTFVETMDGTMTYGTEESFVTEPEQIEILPDPIEDEEAGESPVEIETAIIAYYNEHGIRSNKPYHGLNIILYSDGKTKKIILK